MLKPASCSIVYTFHLVNFASTLWDGCSEVHQKKTTTKKKNSLHCRTAKLILSDLSIPTDDKLKALKLLPLTKQLKDNQAVMMFEVCNGETSEYIHSLFTRSTGDMFQTTCFHHTPVYTCTKPVSILRIINLEPVSYTHLTLPTKLSV